RTYRSWARAPSPRIQSVEVRFDLYPERRALRATGSYQLRNRGERPVGRVLINLPDDLTVRRLALRPVNAPPGSAREKAVRRFSDGGRDCSAFRAEGKILNFFSALSADYRVRRDRWQDVDIEIHHHPGHEYDVERMVQAVKDTLAYATAAFGPYPQKVIR